MRRNEFKYTKYSSFYKGKLKIKRDVKYKHLFFISTNKIDKDYIK